MIEYQDSGVEWIGQIPSHWEVKRLKDITKLNPPCTELNIDAAVSFLPMENLRCAQISCQEIPFIEARGKYTYFEDEDLLIAKVTPCFENNNIAIAKELKNGIGFGSSEIFVLRCSDILNSFLFYYVLSSQFKEKACSTMCGVGGLKRISPLFMTTYKLAIPPLSEQQAIADYLDEKTSEIDSQVSLIKEKVAVLQKLKQSLINKVVTKGLNPNAELKDSGVEWLGQIPAHWEVKRLKDISFLYSGLTGKSGEDFTPEYEEGTKPYIPFTNVLNNFEINPNKFNFVHLSSCEIQNKVHCGDLIFLMSSEDYDSIAKSAVVSDELGEVYLNSFCRGLRFTKNSIYPKFINYLLSADCCRDALRFEARGFTRINIKIEKIASHFVFFPPLSEQQAIADYLDEKTSEIDEQISLLNQKAETYNKLKQSLIDEVVTGKRRI